MHATSMAFSSDYNEGCRKGRFAMTRMESPQLDVMVRRKLIAVVQSDFKRFWRIRVLQDNILKDPYPYVREDLIFSDRNGG